MDVVLTGAPLVETRAVERVAHGDPWDERQYQMYPPTLKFPYGARRSAFGGLPQWVDLGLYLQTVMLMLRAEGLHSCPQMAWSQVRKTVA